MDSLGHSCQISFLFLTPKIPSTIQSKLIKSSSVCQKPLVNDGKKGFKCEKEKVSIFWSLQEWHICSD